MVTRIVLLCMGIGLLPGVAAAQDAGPVAPATKADLEAFVMRIETRLSQWQTDAGARITKLEEKVQALSDLQEAGRSALEQIAKKGDDGKYFPRIDTSHEPTRSELRKAIAEVAPEVGSVVIRNKTATTQAVAVNGTTYDVLANSDRSVSVPYRHFEVRTSNNRALSWHFNYPKTEAIVDIVSMPASASSTTVQ